MQSAYDSARGLNKGESVGSIGDIHPNTADVLRLQPGLSWDGVRMRPDFRTPI